MLTTRRALIFSFASILTLAACAPGNDAKNIDGQFWQRVKVSESIYQQGPKAQQMLNRDISRCVVELRELERLGVLKDAIPTDFAGRTLDPDQQALYDWDTPERSKHLYAEHTDYTDFEGCMLEHGWERIEYVPYDVGRKGRANYLRAHVDHDYNDMPEKHQARHTPSSNEYGTYGELNE